MLSIRPSVAYVCFLVVCIIQAVAAQSSAATTFYVDFTRVTLLSGGVTDCATSLTASTCIGGVAAAAALERNFSRFGETHLLLNEFDFQTAFVQMHPLAWGVNTLIFDYFGYPVYTARPSLFTATQDPLAITNGTAAPLATNVIMKPSGGFAFGKVYWIDPVTGVGYLHVTSAFQPNSDDPVKATIPPLRILRQKAPLVVMLYDADTTASDFAPQLAAGITAAGFAMSLMPEVIVDYNTLVTPYVINQTTIVGCVPSATVLCSVPVTYAPVAGAATAVSVGGPRQWSTTIPSSLKDATYLTQQTYLLKQANLAGRNDPLLGYSNGTMPLTRAGSVRMCMAGECPLGNFWCDGMRSVYKDTISFTTSGGTRGPGWASGPIHVSDLWASLPFANQLCRGTLAGVTIFEIFNQSVFYAQFQSLNTPTGDHLLQTSGLRYRYNTQLPPAARLISIDVLNPTTQVWEPLQRLQLYTFASDGFTCGSFPPFTAFIQRKQYPGETWAISDLIIQETQEKYLHSISNYTPGVFGRQVNDTNATVPMNLVQTIDECEMNTYWDPKWYTCFPCPVGQHQPTPGLTFCVADTTSSATGTILAAVLIPVVVLSAAIVAGVMAYRQMQAKKLMRNVEFAPKDGLIAIMFTDIEASTKLWSNAPQSMSVALDYHHEQIRLAINDNKGYEVKTAGDSFMIAFPSVDAAVRAAVDMQRAFLKHAYPAAIDKCYAAQSEDELLAIVDDPADIVTSSDPLWNGLRVRIGIHAGTPTVVFDDIAKGYDYYGPPVNIAARTEAVATGGQVCLTSDTFSHLSTMPDVEWKELGYFELKGVSEPVKIYQVLPKELASRVYKDLGDEKVAKVGVDDDTQSMMGSEDTTAAAATAEFTAFLRTLFRAVSSGERSTLLKKLTKGWRIHVTNEDDATEAMASRVSKAMTRERTRIERQREALGGSTNSRHSDKFTASTQNHPNMVTTARVMDASAEDVLVPTQVPTQE